MPKVDLTHTDTPETKLGTLTKLGDNLTVFSAPSTSRPGVSHFVVVYPDERGITCTCEGWRFNRHCWHMDSVPLCMAEGPLLDDGVLTHQGHTFNLLASKECYYIEGHQGGHSWETQ